MTSGGGKKSTYVDDVFSTKVYGPDSNAQGARTITTNIDYNEGALIWTKSRGSARQHMLVDTVRGVSKQIFSDSHVAESTASTPSWAINTLTETGYNIGTGSDYRDANYFGNNEKYASWNFRKAEGFFDIVTWTGNATNSSSPPRQIAHNLGSVPGAIWVKCLTANQSWACYHKSLGATRYMHLSDPGAGGTSVAWWNNTEPTSTHFTVGYDGQVNENNQQYVAYVFASEDTSTAATARSVYYPAASGNGVRTSASNDFMISSNDFTLEGYFYYTNITSGYQILWDTRISSSTEICLIAGKQPDGKVYIENGPDGYGGTTILRTAQPEITEVNKWYHIAFSKHNGTLKLFINGVEKGSTSTSVGFGGNNFQIGNAHQQSGAYAVQGYISNVRFINQQGIYTSNFTPSTEPLTTTSQGATASKVKLLCFQNTTVNGTTVNASGGWVSNVGTPVVSTFSPFLDLASPSKEFGEGGDQNIIKCREYVGNGNANGPEVYLGWEPQWVLIKASDRAAEWSIVDCIRGIVTGQNDAALYPDATDAEVTSYDIMDVNATGFQLKTSNQLWNQNTKHYVYMAIRRPDGAVGKPAEAGTDAFTMDVGRDSSTIPNFDSGFPVDFAIARNPSATDNNLVGCRLTGPKYLIANTSADGLNNATGWSWDSNLGWNNHGSYGTSYQSWMWKRGAGFDVVTYTGDGTGGVGRQISHGMNSAPQMIITKARDVSYEWPVWHTGLSAIGNNLRLNGNYAQLSANNNIYGGTGNALPTTDHWTVGSHSLVNANGNTYLALLFASVDGISKVGYYTGDGTTDGSKEINLGFTPRFVILKSTNHVTDWWVFDTTRGLPASGNASYLKMNETNVQASTVASINATSTGFKLVQNYNAINANGSNIVYYAHA